MRKAVHHRRGASRALLVIARDLLDTSGLAEQHQHSAICNQTRQGPDLLPDHPAHVGHAGVPADLEEQEDQRYDSVRNNPIGTRILEPFYVLSFTVPAAPGAAEQRADLCF